MQSTLKLDDLGIRSGNLSVKLLARYVAVELLVQCICELGVIQVIVFRILLPQLLKDLRMNNPFRLPTRRIELRLDLAVADECDSNHKQHRANNPQPE